MIPAAGGRGWTNTTNRQRDGAEIVALGRHSPGCLGAPCFPRGFWHSLQQEPGQGRKSGCRAGLGSPRAAPPAAGHQQCHPTTPSPLRPSSCPSWEQQLLPAPPPPGEGTRTFRFPFDPTGQFLSLKIPQVLLNEPQNSSSKDLSSGGKLGGVPVGWAEGLATVARAEPLCGKRWDAERRHEAGGAAKPGGRERENAAVEGTEPPQSCCPAALGFSPPNPPLPWQNPGPTPSPAAARSLWSRS